MLKPVTASAVATPLLLPPKKVSARVAFIQVREDTTSLLRECFRQFGIQSVGVDSDAERRLRREKFEACVVELGHPEAEMVLSAARTSPSNSRIVIYGICRGTQEAMRFSRYGINALIDMPVDRQSALKVVRATHLLVVHELRRYVRLPIVTELQVKYGGGQFRATSREISAGGMSMKTSEPLKKEQAVEVSFALPHTGKTIAVRATVAWLREGDRMVGVRFDPSDEIRLEVKRWIDNYLEVGS